MFCLPNLVSKNVAPCTPWTFQCSVPEEVRGKEGKKARDKWINTVETQHQVYSAFEGFIASQRVSETRGSDEGNPPFKLHAFVVDIDAHVPDEELKNGINRLGFFMPNYYEKTLSGYVRLVFLFEKPVSFPNRRFAVEFLTLALARAKFDHVAVAFDKAAFLEPNRYYTNSGEWLAIDEVRRIPYDLLQGWVVEVSEKHLWRKDRGAIDIPLPVVLLELEKKWPQHSWPGDFVEGSQGPSFWIEGASAPKSAIVKPTGLFTFSAHAVKPFYSWSDLLGASFVEKYASEMLGKAVEGIYHDGKSYWRKDGFGDWKPFAKEDIQAHLTVDRGLSAVKDGSTPSETSRAIQYVQNWQGIIGAAPFVFQPQGTLKRNGFKFLNTHTRRAMVPAGEPSVWGDTGKFPFISKFLGGVFSSSDQLPYFTAWLSRFYRGAHEAKLESGQNVFLLGPAGVGKTFLSQGLLPRLLGGSAEAEKYLLGETQFNSELFEAALWTVDDNSATVTVDAHRRFSAMVKKMAANTTFSYHAKFRVPCSVDWLGRVFVTANDDEESARIVPDLSISILDKLMLFRAAPVPAVVFPGRGQLLQILETELPYFARYLLDFTIPQELVGSARYGVQAYHEPSLMVVAEQSSRSAGFSEILEHWQSEWFRENKEPHWEGSSFQFLMSLHTDELAAAAGVRLLTADAVGRHLANLKGKGFPIEIVPKGTNRNWRILRPADVKHVAPLPVNGTFKKN